jgi:hypothetical protein
MRLELRTHVSSISTKGDACCVCASPLSRWKKTLLVYVCLFCPDERRHVLFSGHPYRYIGHPYNNEPVLWLHPRTSQDLATTRSGDDRGTNQDLAATTTRRHHKHILITYRHKQDHNKLLMRHGTSFKFLIRACLDGVLRKLPELGNNIWPYPSRFPRQQQLTKQDWMQQISII